jgi:hypothetical protein
MYQGVLKGDPILGYFAVPDVKDFKYTGAAPQRKVLSHFLSDGLQGVAHESGSILRAAAIFVLKLVPDSGAKLGLPIDVSAVDLDCIEPRRFGSPCCLDETLDELFDIFYGQFSRQLSPEHLSLLGRGPDGPVVDLKAGLGAILVDNVYQLA